MMTGVFVYLPRESAAAKLTPRNTKVVATSPKFGKDSEEIIRTSLRSPRSSVAEKETHKTGGGHQAKCTDSPQLKTRQTKHGAAYPCSPVTRQVSCDMHKKQSAKTIGAVNDSLCAAKSVLKADGSDCSRRVNKTNLEKAVATSPRLRRGSEEIIRTSLRSPRSSVTEKQTHKTGGAHQARSTDSLQLKTRQTKQGAAYPCSPVTRRVSCDMHREQATKTIGAVKDALSAIESALKAQDSDCSRRLNKTNLEMSCPSPSTTASDDTESDVGTESIASTACTSTPSEDGVRCMVSSLRDSRRLMKERVHSKERSRRFTHGLLNKLSAISDTLDEEDFLP